MEISHRNSRDTDSNNENSRNYKGTTCEDVMNANNMFYILDFYPVRFLNNMSYRYRKVP